MELALNHYHNPDVKFLNARFIQLLILFYIEEKRQLVISVKLVNIN